MRKKWILLNPWNNTKPQQDNHIELETPVIDKQNLLECVELSWFDQSCTIIIWTGCILHFIIFFWSRCHFFSVPYVAPLIKNILNETTSQSLYQFRSKSVVKRTPSSFDEDGAIISRILHRMSFYWWVHSFYNIVSLNFTFT